MFTFYGNCRKPRLTSVCTFLSIKTRQTAIKYSLNSNNNIVLKITLSFKLDFNTIVNVDQDFHV